MTNCSLERVVTIHQPQYLPWLGYLDKAAQADIFIYLDDVQFIKNEFKNRNRIKGPGGAQWLTVPVHYSFGAVINSVEIADPRFAKKHSQALRSCYGKAPYFGQYFEQIDAVLSKPYKRLSDLCLEATSWLLANFNIQVQTCCSSAFSTKREERSLRLLDLCLAKQANVYLSGPSGRDYLDLEAFADAGVAVRFHHYEHPVYSQLFGEFVPYLSALDALFMLGPEAAPKLLKAAGQKESSLREA